MARSTKSGLSLTDGLDFSRIDDNSQPDSVTETIRELKEAKEKAEREVEIARKEAEEARKMARHETKSRHVQILITESSYEKIKREVANGKAKSMNDYINKAIDNYTS